MIHIAVAQDHAPEPEWPTMLHSRHMACDQCGRSFEPLTPHSFSFNSYLGWCPQCEGLGTQTGANPAALLRGSQLTLDEGALALWPSVDKTVSQLMLAAFSTRSGVPLNVPFDLIRRCHNEATTRVASRAAHNFTRH